MRGLPNSWWGRVRITPATVISVLALVMAAGGGAYASTTLGNASLAGWAVVSAKGKIVRSSGAVSAKRTGTGSYIVAFNQSVSSCAYKATIGQTGAGVPSIGDIGVARKGTDAVAVHTTSLKGKAASYSFHVAVVC